MGGPKNQDFWPWINTLLGFLLYILVLLYLLFWFLVERTVHFHYCITCPNIRTVLKKCIVLLIFITVLLFLLYLCTILKNQACNIYKYWSYNRNLRLVDRWTHNCWSLFLFWRVPKLLKIGYFVRFSNSRAKIYQLFATAAEFWWLMILQKKKNKNGIPFHDRERITNLRKYHEKMNILILTKMYNFR